MFPKALLFVFNPIVIINQGECGVVFFRINGIQKKVMEEGLHFRISVIEKVIKFDFRAQKFE